MTLLRFQSLFTFWLDSQLLGCFSSFRIWHWSSLFCHVAWKQRQRPKQWQLIKRLWNLKDFYDEWKRYSKRQFWRSPFLHYLHSAIQAATNDLHLILKCGNRRPRCLTSTSFTWLSVVILWTKHQRFPISVICVCSLTSRAACGTPEQICAPQSFSRSAHSASSDWKDRKWWRHQLWSSAAADTLEVFAFW